MCIILSNSKRGQTPILISHTMKQALSELHSFNTLALRPSGPDALCIFRLFNSFKNPLGSTVISPKGVNGLVPFDGILVPDSRVKADPNCLLQILALSTVSVFKIPFSLSENGRQNLTLS